MEVVWRRTRDKTYDEEINNGDSIVYAQCVFVGFVENALLCAALFHKFRKCAYAHLSKSSLKSLKCAFWMIFLPKNNIESQISRLK